MANEIYHRSNWGNAVNDIAWGDTYEKFDATNEMFVRSDNYENSNETDKLMAAINPKPSILLTPTAYDNGSLHSVKPVKTFGSELVTNGDFATDSDWTANNATISGGKANFNIVSGTYAKLTQTISYTSGRVYKLTAIVNGTNGNKMRFRDDVANSGGLTTSNGEIIMDGTDQSVEIIFTSNSNSDEIAIERQDQSGDYSFTVDNVSVKEVIDADFDFTRSTTATRENSSGNIESVAANLPRIDYTYGTGSLLLEPQSTNLITYSEQFDNAAWDASSDVLIESGYLAPDGTNNAYKITKNGNNSKVALFLGGTPPFTKSIYAKTVSGTGTAFFGEGSTTGNGVLSTVTTQWQRFEITVNDTNFYGIDFRGSSTLTEVLIWGAQMEEKSHATSYIPTSGTTVTRSADAANNSGSSDLINSTEGVLYAEIAALADDLTNRVISLSDGTADERVVLSYLNQTNRIRCFIKSGGSFYATQDKVVSDITDFHKIAYKYKSGETKLFVDGSLITSSSNTFSITGLNVLQFANGTPTASPLQGKVKSVAVFKEALTDEELTALTT